MNTANTLITRWLGQQQYHTIWEQMRTFTNTRDENTVDEIWLLEHDPVFTQGQNGQPEHVLNPGNIPVVQTDRGGQVTYHGPGQLMVYTLIDLKRKKLTVREIVTCLEQSVIDFMGNHGITAAAQQKAPGVYIEQSKICSIGLRIRRGCSYHGIAFNIQMDLAPFSCINPCGFSGLNMTQLSAFVPRLSVYETACQLVTYLMKNLGYTTQSFFVDHHVEQNQWTPNQRINSAVQKN